MEFDVSKSVPLGARIKVIGVGGGGGNAINTMIRASLDGVQFISANTDVQSLRLSLAPTKIQLGRELTKGLGAGADPDIGRDAALEDRHAIQEAIGDADMVFITAGMGGGTGTGGASIIAQIARDMGALSVAVVTKPFMFEGKRRLRQADLGIQKLRETVDTLITIPNQRLLQVASPDLTMISAFQMADNVLLNAVKGISDIINTPGTVNVDFADVKTVMSCMGQALMGIGAARGSNRAAEAARQAISSPLLEDVDIMGATGILINISAGSNVTLMEVNEACSIVQEAAHEDANIIFGAVIDEALADEMRVTVIATGFPTDREVRPDGNDAGKRNLFGQPSRRPALNSSVARSSFSSSSSYTSSTTRSAAPVAQPLAAPATTAEPVVTAPVAPPVAAPLNFSSAAKLAHSIAEDLRFSVTNEAHDLAKLTMQNMGTTELPSFEQSAVADLEVSMDIELDAEVATAEEIEVATLESIVAPFVIEEDSFLVLTPETVSSPVAALVSSEQTTDVERFGASASFSDSYSTMEDTAVAAPELTAESDVNFDFDLLGAASNLDAKIDEALELAERLRSDVDIVNDEEILDIPAFLRNSSKEVGFK
jgi:cell division protein FtsZ